MKAARFGRLEVVKFLVQAGVDKEKQSKVSVVFLYMCLLLLG
jgi:hypothetical protein